MMLIYLHYLLEVSICLSCLYLFYHFLLRELPSFQWNRIYLMAMYVISFTLPLLHFNVYPVYIEPVIGVQSSPTIASNIVDAIPVSQSLDIYSYIFIFYVAIASLLMIMLIVNVFSVFFKIWKSDKERHSNYTIVAGITDDKVYSFFRYLIKPKDQKLINEILEHELVHIRQHHSIDLIISEICKAILWFNPFIYLSQKAVKINHEYICDHKASMINGRYNYAKLLSDISYHESSYSYVNNFSYKLKNRILMLQKLDELTQKRWRYTLFLPLLFLGLQTYAFDTYNVINIPQEQQRQLLDTVPYQIDTTTVFDPDTYEKTFKYEKYVIDTITVFDADTYEETVKFERRLIEEGQINSDAQESRESSSLINYNTVKKSIESIKASDASMIDTVVVVDKNTNKEKEILVRIKNDCYLLLWGGRSFGESTNVSTKEVSKLFHNNSIEIRSIKDKCKKVSSWSGRIIIVPFGKKDVRVQDISMNDSKLKEAMINGEGYNAPGTKIFIEKFKVNGYVELSGMVLTIE